MCYPDVGYNNPINVVKCCPAKAGKGCAKLAKNIHVVPQNGKWAVRVEGSNQVLSTHLTQGAAIDQARIGAQRAKVEVVIHRPNGQIRDRDSYGNDPNPPKDQKH